MRSSHFIAIAVAVFALIWIVSGVLSPGETSAPPVAQAEPQKKVMDVRVREIKAEPYIDRVEVTGRTRASKKVVLKAETDGQVTAVLKEEGDAASLGEPLAELELRDRAARVREAKQRVNQRSIEYNAAKKLEDKGFNSRVRLAQALADLEDAKAALANAEIDLAKTKIKAPFDGIINEQEVEVGDYMDVGNALFTVVDLDPIEFVGFVSERRIHDIELGGRARAVFLGGQALEGTISYIAPAANEQTRTFRIIISAPNADLSIKEGLTATIYIPAAQKRAHKISPSILSLNDAGQIGVKIVNTENKVEFVPVRILADKTDGMWIFGPPETARIITVGQDFVSEGQTVNPVPSSGEGLL